MFAWIIRLIEANVVHFIAFTSPLFSCVSSFQFSWFQFGHGNKASRLIAHQAVMTKFSSNRNQSILRKVHRNIQDLLRCNSAFFPFCLSVALYRKNSLQWVLLLLSILQVRSQATLPIYADLYDTTKGWRHNLCTPDTGSIAELELRQR